MYDQMLENFRKAAESTLQLQQEMFRSWAQQWHQQVPGTLAGLNPANGAGADGVRAVQKKLSETVTDLLTKHRETLDAQYRAGIRTIEDAFKVGDARDPEQFRRLTEALWRQSFDCLKNVAESQVRDTQAAFEKMFDVVAKAVPAAAKGK
jgi:type II secretory pathway pseudopilin PulG